MRSGIIENTVSTLPAQQAFLNNFENVVNRRVDIREDIKCYQENLSYASSKVDYSMGENIYMLPSDMNLNVRSGTVGYNNKILVSDGKFSLGRNDKVNPPAMKSHQTRNSNEVQAQKHKTQEPQTITHKNQECQTITHNEEKIALVLFLAGGFAIWNIF